MGKRSTVKVMLADEVTTKVFRQKPPTRDLDRRGQPYPGISTDILLTLLWEPNCVIDDSFRIQVLPGLDP